MPCSTVEASALGQKVVAIVASADGVGLLRQPGAGGRPATYAAWSLTDEPVGQAADGRIEAWPTRPRSGTCACSTRPRYAVPAVPAPRRVAGWSRTASPVAGATPHTQKASPLGRFPHCPSAA
jgi:hypothetical protein